MQAAVHVKPTGWFYAVLPVSALCSLSLSLSLMAQHQQLLALGASPNQATADWCMDCFLRRGLPPEGAAKNFRFILILYFLLLIVHKTLCADFSSTLLFLPEMARSAAF